MWILPLVGYIGVVVGFCFLTLAIASGLYYLSELVEEHTVLAKRILTRLIYGVITVITLLWLIDGFPFWLSLLGVASHIIYASNLRRFPYVRLTDPLFLLSCALVCLNHWLGFRYFSNPQLRRSTSHVSSNDPTAWRRPYYEYETVPTFTEVASYFGLCVWLVPFALFVSLSAGENVLPTMATVSAGGAGAEGVDSAAGGLSVGPEKRSKPIGMAKALVDAVREWTSETGELLGLWKGEKTRRF